MGLFDKAEEAAEGHEGEIVQKVGDEANQATGGKFSSEIQQGEQLGDQQFGDQGGADQAADPNQAPQQ